MLLYPDLLLLLHPKSCHLIFVTNLLGPCNLRLLIEDLLLQVLCLALDDVVHRLHIWSMGWEWARDLASGRSNNDYLQEVHGQTHK